MKARRIQTAWVAAAAIILGAAGCTAHKEAASQPPSVVAAPAPLPSGTISAGLATATATVKAINQKTRMVTLQRSDGSLIKFRAGDEVRNLPQVKVGDQVNVSYYESLAYEVKKPGQGAPGVGVAEQLGRAKLGEKPGGTAARVTTLTATIAAIDRTANTVTLRTPDGESTTIKARDPQKLNSVSVGDLVEITYTEAVGISVEEAAKK